MSWQEFVEKKQKVMEFAKELGLGIYVSVEFGDLEPNCESWELFWEEEENNG